jgi:phosphate-selective porin OprO/OprP
LCDGLGERARDCNNHLGGLEVTVRSLVAYLLFAALTPAASPLAAQGQGADGVASRFDRIWQQAELFKGDDESLLRSVRFTGRLQLDLAAVDSANGDHGEFNVRRFRLGLEAAFRGHFTLHVEADLNPQEASPLYTQLTDVYLAWSPAKTATVTVGKHSAGFTLDGMTSSKKLLTIDRNNLSNNLWFTDEYIPGLSIAGAKRQLSYQAGVFSSGDKNPEFGDFEGGVFVLLTLGYDFAPQLGARQALLRLNLVDNEPDPDNGFTRALERIASLNFSYEGRDWGLRTDVAAASGYLGQSDLDGFVVMPFYKATEAIEVVARYTSVASDDANGVRLPRYENTVTAGRGDRYDEIYLGLNYYWYGHQLKLQNGLEHADMRDRAADGGDYRGWAWTTALRVSW